MAVYNTIAHIVGFEKECKEYRKLAPVVREIKALDEQVKLPEENSLPDDMKELLPEPEEIVKRLRIFEQE